MALTTKYHFVHGLRGHHRETWETLAAHTESNDGRAKKNHGIPSMVGTKIKTREVHHDKTIADSHGAESRHDQTIFWIQDFLAQDIPYARILTYGYNADIIGVFQASNKNSCGYTQLVAGGVV